MFSQLETHTSMDYNAAKAETSESTGTSTPIANSPETNSLTASINIPAKFEFGRSNPKSENPERYTYNRHELTGHELLDDLHHQYVAQQRLRLDVNLEL